MGIFSVMGDSFGCSATGERLVSAARDGDFQEAKAILEYNPRLAKYSTFGVRNSPLHYSATHGHHEIVSLLVESGVDMNLRNYRGQTPLMQACLYGHWKVVQTLILFKANIHKKDYLSGGTALHFAALNGHARCIRLVVSDYVPSSPEIWNFMRRKTNSNNNNNKESNKPDCFDEVALSRVVNKKADGGITALHLAALNGHAESVQLLLGLGSCVSDVTIDDGSTIDLIGAGSMPLHYAACGGNAVCCQLLVAAGASLTAENANGWTPLMVARSWHKNWLESVLSKQPEARIRVLPSPFLSLPLMSIVKIARDCGWRRPVQSPSCVDPCVICLEMKCMVAAEGCGHEFCTKCALYLCSTSASCTSPARAPPGSISCPLCRSPIVSFARLGGSAAAPVKALTWTSPPLSMGSTGRSVRPLTRSMEVDLGCTSSLRSLSFRKLKVSGSLCNTDGASETTPCLVSCLRPELLQRSASQRESMVIRRSRHSSYA